MRELEIYPNDPHLSWYAIIDDYADELKQAYLRQSKQPNFNEAKQWFDITITKPDWDYNLKLELAEANAYLQAFGLGYLVIKSAEADFINRIKQVYLGNLRHSIEN